MAIEPDNSKEDTEARRQIEEQKAEQRSSERDMTAAERTAEKNQEARDSRKDRNDKREEQRRTDARNSLIDAVLKVQPGLQRSDAEAIFRPPLVSERPPAHVPSSADGGKTKFNTVSVWTFNPDSGQPKRIALGTT